MRLLIQRVKKASVSIDGKIVGNIGNGFAVLFGACETDDTIICDKLIKKMMGLRIFADENGKTNLSLSDVNGELLLVSQFTLYADCKKGNRPSFIKAGNPEHANVLYEYAIKKIKDEYHIDVQTGVFGADMLVSIENDGPFTIMLDSNEIM